MATKKKKVEEVPVQSEPPEESPHGGAQDTTPVSAHGRSEADNLLLLTRSTLVEALYAALISLRVSYSTLLEIRIRALEQTRNEAMDRNDAEENLFLNKVIRELQQMSLRFDEAGLIITNEFESTYSALLDADKEVRAMLKNEASMQAELNHFCSVVFQQFPETREEPTSSNNLQDLLTSFRGKDNAGV